MKINAPTIIVSQEIASIFQKLENPSLFESLMPDNLAHFSSPDGISFSFSLKGMPEIFLEKKLVNPYNQITYGAKEGKLPFALNISFSPINDKETSVSYSFEGEFNPMVALMVKSPITKLLETMAEKTKFL